MISREATIGIYRGHLSRGRAALAELTGTPLEVRSRGAWVYTPDGEGFLSCGGYGVFLLGHCHPAVVSAVVGQAESHPLHTALLVDPLEARAARALLEVAPAGLEGVRFTNSGTEATETALKLARLHGKRHVVSTRGGYHGKTLGALSATANPVYQQPFEPLLPASCVTYGDVEELERELSGRAEGCCVIVEPIQGEGGVVVPPEGYLRAVSELCARAGALLIVDEIQTGLGRTGRWWALEREGIVPDVLLVGKGLSGGVVPVAAVLASAEVYRPLSEDPMLHSSTFAGSPIAMAAAEAAVQTIAAEGLVERAAKLGAKLKRGIEGAVAEHGRGLVRAVRGEGLLIGVELVSPALVVELGLELLERRVLVNHSLNAHGVLRLTPPAILSEAELELLVGAFSESLAAATSNWPTETTRDDPERSASENATNIGAGGDTGGRPGAAVRPSRAL